MTSGNSGGESPRVLRWLLRLFPRDVRGQFEAEFEYFLVFQRKEKRYHRPFIGNVRFWFDVTWDTLRGGISASSKGMVQKWGGVMRRFAALLANAWRSNRRNPKFSLGVAAILALGIGATTAVFSVGNWALYRPVPGIVDQEQLVTIRFETESGGAYFVSHPDLEDLAAGATQLENLVASHPTSAHLSAPGATTPLRVEAALVSEGYLDVLGVKPILGVGIAESGDPNGVLISHSVWVDVFGGDPALIGSPIRINGNSFTVVGIAPPGFRGPANPQVLVDVWLPIDRYQAFSPQLGADGLTRRRAGLYMDLIGRMTRRTDMDLVSAQMTTVAARIAERFGEETRLSRSEPVVRAGIGLDPWMADRITKAVRILFGIVVLLLVLGCANAGNLLLARVANRDRELSIRRSLGARPSQVMAQLVTEGLMLGVMGGVLGVLVSAFLLELFDGATVFRRFPPLQDVPIDLRVVAFSLALASVTGVLFSLAPAMAGVFSTGDGVAAKSVNARTGRLRGMLTVAQVAVSLALVVGAGVLLRTVSELNQIDLGLDLTGVVEATVDPNTQGYDSDARRVFWRDLMRQVRERSEIQSAGFAWAPLHGSVRSNVSLGLPGTDPEAFVNSMHNIVTDGFLGSVGMSLISGRDFSPEEVLSEVPRDVVILDQHLADRLFPGGEAVGKQVEMKSPAGKLHTVIGVVATSRAHALDGPEEGYLLEPLGQSWIPGFGTIYARGEVSVESAVRDVLRSIDPGLPFYDMQAVETRVRTASATPRVLATISSAFAVLAVTLAAVGLYGVLLYTVNMRRREVGIRMALGAGQRSVRQLMVRQGMALALIGIPVGLVLGFFLSRLMSSQLDGVASVNLAVFSVAALTLIGVAGLASWIPARIAARVDPARALRADG